jgi:hypothetical protein
MLGLDWRESAAIPVIALIDQVRWTPERIATFRSLLESMSTSG